MDETPDKNKIGMWTSTSLVVGNMIGSGLFMLPAALAVYGGISLVGWVISGFGAMSLALVFSWLSRMVKGAAAARMPTLGKGLVSLLHSWWRGVTGFQFGVQMPAWPLHSLAT